MPTPAAGNFNDGESLESWEARRQANLAKGINGNGQGTPLGIAVQKLLMLPTPAARDHKGAYPRGLTRSDTGRPSSPQHLGLPAAVSRLLPTPQANLGTNGGGQSAAKRLAGGHSPSVEDQVLDLPLLPTPLTGEARHGSPNQPRSRGDTMLTGEVIRLATGTDLSAAPTRQGKLLTGRSMSPPSGAGRPSAAGPSPARSSRAAMASRVSRLLSLSG